MKNPLCTQVDGQQAKQNHSIYRRIIVGFEMPKRNKLEQDRRKIISVCKSCLLMKQ
ncbi:MAG: hypothetical protein U0175_36840 [Caldilineaceae bacterium]